MQGTKYELTIKCIAKSESQLNDIVSQVFADLNCCNAPDEVDINIKVLERG